MVLTESVWSYDNCKIEKLNYFLWPYPCSSSTVGSSFAWSRSNWGLSHSANTVYPHSRRTLWSV